MNMQPDSSTIHMPERQPWYTDAVFYGIDITRFYDSNADGVGDITGLIAKLDYIASLGVSCIWLLPFYPSDRRDNGYDVIDYKNVDPEVGSLDDFRRLVTAAHELDLKIIIDLVVHHTSDKHPWFLESARDPKSKYRDYYVWSDDKPHDREDAIAFPTEENDVWHYSDVAGKYYHHKFYHFQPDLNIANPQVREEINAIVSFWMEQGVDGFRIDAATFMFAEKGITGTGSESNAFLEELHALIRQYNPEAVLLGEADVAPHRIQEYFGDGRRMHLLYNFLANNSLWESLARRKAGPLGKRLHDLKGISGPNGIWLNFLRNLDELNLDKLEADKQAYVLDTFAPEPTMRIFDRGIRRRTAPMLEDGRRLRMAFSLMFSLPGAPMYVYGDEIGMGENLATPGRRAVRLPMQWDNSRHGGFSSAEDTPNSLLECIVSNGERGYLAVNVADQQDDPSSQLEFCRRLATVRQLFPEIGSGYPELIETGVESVLALAYDRVLLLHNLAGEPVDFDIDLPNDATVLFGDEYPSDRTLPAYGYCWIRL